MVIKESIHITFDESNHCSLENVVNDDADEEIQKENSLNNKQDNASCENQEEWQEEQTNMEQNEGNSQSFPKEWRYISSYLKDLILGDPSWDVITRSSLRNTCEHTAFISQIELKSFSDVEKNKSWIMAM